MTSEHAMAGVSGAFAGVVASAAVPKNGPRVALAALAVNGAAPVFRAAADR